VIPLCGIDVGDASIVRVGRDPLRVGDTDAAMTCSSTEMEACDPPS
jgi:hypothetical protein